MFINFEIMSVIRLKKSSIILIHIISDYPASTPNEYQTIPNTSTVSPTEIQPTVSERPVLLRGIIIFLNFFYIHF